MIALTCRRPNVGIVDLIHEAAANLLDFKAAPLDMIPFPDFVHAGDLID